MVHGPWSIDSPKKQNGIRTGMPFFVIILKIKLTTYTLRRLKSLQHSLFPHQML
jgi:hypothetical protein